MFLQNSPRRSAVIVRRNVEILTAKVVKFLLVVNENNKLPKDGRKHVMIWPSKVKLDRWPSDKLVPANAAGLLCERHSNTRFKNIYICDKQMSVLPEFRYWALAPGSKQQMANSKNGMAFNISDSFRHLQTDDNLCHNLCDNVCVCKVSNKFQIQFSPIKEIVSNFRYYV